ncbi:Endonuclease, Uma2 family (restriction endonuclease fold) [Methylobacterium sp. ap11]|uniref:Uma2 family endonuclease n=1 Tax=Methylobacterium sp. ap11 TaxID=1761799 RepID=UPI0008D24744|nr:Uma2 family endonuclease [Methylobacterium sp. ap11]SEO59927.1 Endonuclease, Uma2 family (restriction endonuclease fold) [Methylobacterium sp. ap11]
MTIHVTPDSPLPRRFTAGDLRLMLESGILREDERIELLDGELVEMAAKGFAHDVVKNALMRRLVPALPDTIYLGIESTLQLRPNLLLEPDLLLAPVSARSASPEGFCTIPGSEILLVIEVAASSLAYDRGRKAVLYARHGVREYWVIDAQERTASVHREPATAGYRDVTELPREAILRPQADALTALGVALADLG